MWNLKNEFYGCIMQVHQPAGNNITRENINKNNPKATFLGSQNIQKGTNFQMREIWLKFQGIVKSAATLAIETEELSSSYDQMIAKEPLIFDLQYWDFL